MAIEKLVVVTKKTDLENLLYKHSTTSQAKFILESQGQSYEEYAQAHATYSLSVAAIKNMLPAGYSLQFIENDLLPTMNFGTKDLVVSIGDPGLVVNIAKYLDSQPLISINPDPKRFDDVFSTCHVEDTQKVFSAFFNNDLFIEKLTMAKATTNDGQTLYALNDFFIGQKTHRSAKYTLNFQGDEERQSSSGIVISTGAGSTGWYTSLRLGAEMLALGFNRTSDYSFPRDSRELAFIVREPFPSKVTGTQYISGLIDSHSPLEVSSHMPEGGVIFSDGVENDYLDFLSGSTVKISLAEKNLHLVQYM